MKTEVMVLAMVLCISTGIASAQSAQSPEPGGIREPPPQAYTDCLGKKAGDIVQHMTPEGIVAATCLDSPKGLVARPHQPQGRQSNLKPGQTNP